VRGGRCTGGGRREREAGFPSWREAGEKGKNYATLRNISQSKNAKGREPKNTGQEPGLKGTGSGRFKAPVPPPPLLVTEACCIGVVFHSFYFPLLGWKISFVHRGIPYLGIRYIVVPLHFSQNVSFN